MCAHRQHFAVVEKKVVGLRLLTNSLAPRHGGRGEFHGLHKFVKFGETRKPRFSGFEREKSRDGLFQHSETAGLSDNAKGLLWISQL